MSKSKKRGKYSTKKHIDIPISINPLWKIINFIKNPNGPTGEMYVCDACYRKGSGIILGEKIKNCKIPRENFLDDYKCANPKKRDDIISKLQKTKKPPHY